MASVAEQVSDLVGRLWSGLCGDVNGDGGVAEGVWKSVIGALTGVCGCIGGKGMAVGGAAVYVGYLWLQRRRVENVLNVTFQFYQGATLPQLVRMLVEARFVVHPMYWPRLAFLLLTTTLHTVRKWRQERAYGTQIREFRFRQAPIFVLGYYRSGTTYLHEMLSLDSDAFCTPTLLACWMPHSFLLMEDAIRARYADVVHKRPMDNMRLTFFSPQEEEFALCSSHNVSHLTYVLFPSLYHAYKHYATFDKASPRDVQTMKDEFVYFLKKVCFRYPERYPLSKSPINTGRVRHLLDMFPDAKFIHIARNPYAVFPSNQNLWDKMLSCFNLQQMPTPEVRDQRIFDNYAEVYDAYLRDKSLIPKENLYEVKYEDFEKDPVKHLEGIYSQFNLPNFDQVRPKIQAEAEKRAQYQKNSYKPMDQKVKQQIQQHWGRFFDAFGYEK
eukprot:TRINITY_DN7876_c0_g1_i1.p1 TRINITY_DN7876_c0_g1~~TRINITY_DN7876_c0_g1_i1.p1  ORF type:complete len:441 (+),score=68.27 TRINITY_DN7876_c0_g1_i1:72-1394(+)